MRGRRQTALTSDVTSRGIRRGADTSAFSSEYDGESSEYTPSDPDRPVDIVPPGSYYLYEIQGLLDFTSEELNIFSANISDALKDKPELLTCYLNSSAVGREEARKLWCDTLSVLLMDEFDQGILMKLQEHDPEKVGFLVYKAAMHKKKNIMDNRRRVARMTRESTDESCDFSDPDSSGDLSYQRRSRSRPSGSRTTHTSRQRRRRDSSRRDMWSPRKLRNALGRSENTALIDTPRRRNRRTHRSQATRATNHKEISAATVYGWLDSADKIFILCLLIIGYAVLTPSLRHSPT
ncbi:hypothetical protein TWF730_007380 [Orbilia blumenaviensis]|uniref:Uncharacterized protein n=1 Tax=Orbilia blumenaviensis TaxID=1796055 RepID=A0AAV9VAV8_9PEZI